MYRLAFAQLLHRAGRQSRLISCDVIAARFRDHFEFINGVVLSCYTLRQRSSRECITRPRNSRHTARNTPHRDGGEEHGFNALIRHPRGGKVSLRVCPERNWLGNG